MPEETTNTDSNVNQEVSTDSFINEDGSFKEGWQEKYVPEEYRHLGQVFSGIKNPADMAKMIGNQNATISRQGKGIFPPTEKSNDIEIKEFHRAIGVPESPDGYTLNIPEDVKQYYQDKELMTEAKQRLHQLGLTPKQFAGVMALDAERMKKADEAMQADPLEFYEQALELAMPVMKEQAEKELKEKWGDSYEARLQLANAAITECTTEGEERDRVLDHIGNDPIMADLLATIQQKHHTESSGVDTSLGGGAKYMTIDQQIQALMREPNYADGKTNPAEHKRLIEEVNKLMLQKTNNELLK